MIILSTLANLARLIFGVFLLAASFAWIRGGDEKTGIIALGISLLLFAAIRSTPKSG